MRDSLLWTMFSTFFRIGLFTFGGGYAMIPIIRTEVVERHQWMEDKELMDLIAVAQSCPGVFAVNISIFIGYKLRRTAGSFLCALGAALPSFLIILAIALVFQQFRGNEWVERAFRGIRPVVVALIATPVFGMAKSAKLNRFTVWIPIAATFAIWLLGVNPVYVILLAGMGGYAYGVYKK
ncbi:MAG: chromate transporter [Bacteroidaceae bacterium]|nr:chromate transporter [Bacteroidaceae bacterium]